MTMVRFTFTYDDEFDKDIHNIIKRTPQKRRSEQLRQLIRYGLLYQSEIKANTEVGNKNSIVGISEPDQLLSTNEQNEQTKSIQAEHNQSDLQKRSAVRFRPS